MVQDMKLTNDRKARGVEPRNSSHHFRRTHIPDTVIIFIDHWDSSVRSTRLVESVKVPGVPCQHSQPQAGRIRQVSTILSPNHVSVVWTDHLISGSSEP